MKNGYNTYIKNNLNFKQQEYKMNKPLVLCIMDGVGINPKSLHNAVANANMPCFDNLLKNYPHSKLNASGPAVGLPDGTMGNSEVGHIAIGAGRIVNQFLRRFELENWDDNLALNKFISDVRADNGLVHIVGLMSDGRVHSDIAEIIVIIKQILKSGLTVALHFIADGRDTLPQSATKYIQLLQRDFADAMAEKKLHFNSVSGRYFAMDRNQNMDRTKLAVDAIVNAQSDVRAPNIDVAVQNAYLNGQTDEFIRPVVLDNALPIKSNDGILFANYRSDRARQIVREMLSVNAHMLCFSQYGEGLNESCPALLNDVSIKNTLGDVLADNNKSQLRIAETEKYNHVTYFFDAERNIDFPHEKKILIPSPDVATFDLKPEMSAVEITDALLPCLEKFDVVILNYANGDMVGHTGKENAAKQALEALDNQLARLVPAVLGMGGALMITADHGNVEKMWDEENNLPWTAHTTNQVNLILVSNEKYALADGGLADIAPTMLNLLGIVPPAEMTGNNLIK